MSGIDWSKAPEWATMYGMAGPQWLRMWLNDKQYAYADDVGIPIKFGDNDAFARDRDQFTLIADRPSPDWNGDGLPPVGVVCEAFYMGQPQGVVSVRYSGQCMILWSSDRKSEQCGLSDHYLFKPIRTPEQIAADERETAIDAIVEASKTGLLFTEKRIERSHAIALYNSGLRLP